MPNTEQIKQEVQEEIKKIPPTTDRNLMAALSYVWILSIVMIVMKREDAFIQLHAKQALVLFLLSLLGFIPLLGWLIAGLAIVGMIIGFINAWQGREYHLPYVYGWSQKIHF